MVTHEQMATVIKNRLVEHFKLDGTTVTVNVKKFDDNLGWGIVFGYGFTPEEFSEARRLALPATAMMGLH